MGWISNPKQAAKDKAKQVAHNATHATCCRCDYEDLKIYFKPYGEKWLCKSQVKCEKRQRKNGRETALRHRRFGKQGRFENGHWVD